MKINRLILLVIVGILILILVSSGVMAEHCEHIGQYDTKLDDGDCHAVVYRYLSLGLSDELYVKKISYKTADCITKIDKIDADSSKLYCGRCKITNKAPVSSTSPEEACLEEVTEIKTCEELGGVWCDIGYSCDGDDITSQASDAFSYPGQVCCKGNCKEIPADQPCKKAGGECKFAPGACEYGRERCFPRDDTYTDCALGFCCCIPQGLPVPTTTTVAPTTTAPSGIITCTCDCTFGDPPQTITITAHGAREEGCAKACGGMCGGYADYEKDLKKDCDNCDTYCSDQGFTGDVHTACINACESICGLNETIYGITEIIYYIAGIIAAIMFVIYGYKLITSTTPEERDDAKRGIIYVILALILIAIAGSLVNLLIGNIAHP